MTERKRPVMTEAKLMTIFNVFERCQAIRHVVFLSVAALIIMSRTAPAADVYPYSPAIVSLPASVVATQAHLSAIVIMPDGRTQTNGFAGDTCLANYVGSDGATNGLCVIFDSAGPQADVFTNVGNYKIIIASVTNTFNVLSVSSAEQALFPLVQSNLLAQVLFITGATDLRAEMKVTAQQVLSAVTNGLYADYARMYLALDSFYAPTLNPLDVAAQGGRDFSSVVAEFDSFEITSGLLRATYLYHKGLTQLQARKGANAVSTLCTSLSEFPQGLHSGMARDLLNRIYGGAVAWYPVNDGAGVDTADMVCNGPSGQLTGGYLPAWVSGIEGKALQFGGSGYVIVSNNPALAVLTNRLSVSAWVKASSTNSGPIVSLTVAGGSAGSFALSLSTGHAAFKLFLNGSATEATSTNTLPDSLWHHLAGSYDGEHLRVYLDGAEAGSVSAAGAVDVVNEPLLLGRNADGTGFVGVIDDVRIFGRALSAEDVGDIYSMDTDADGLSNAQELNVYGTDPTKADTDGDGLSDGDEILIHHTNPNNTDSDGDGVSDYAEIWDRGTDPTNSASLNITLYANSVIGSNYFDGLSATVTNGHGPKLTIQAAITNSISGDSIQIAGDQAAYTESVLNPGTKAITLKPTGTVTIRP